MRSWIYPTVVGGFCAWSICHGPTLKKLRSFSVLDATIEIKPFLSSFIDELPLYAYCHATEPCYNLDEIVCVEGREAMEHHFTFEQISCSVGGVWKLPFSDVEQSHLSHLVRSYPLSSERC
jgi:hypothetical protein